MNAVVTSKRLFVSGQQVEYWEHPEIAFGWAREDLQGYADRGQWVLLFNAMLLTTPAAGTDLGS
jgi:hypothetical protein